MINYYNKKLLIMTGQVDSAHIREAISAYLLLLPEYGMDWSEKIQSSWWPRSWIQSSPIRIQQGRHLRDFKYIFFNTGYLKSRCVQLLMKVNFQIPCTLNTKYLVHSIKHSFATVFATGPFPCEYLTLIAIRAHFHFQRTHLISKWPHTSPRGHRKMLTNTNT